QSLQSAAMGESILRISVTAPLNATGLVVSFRPLLDAAPSNANADLITCPIAAASALGVRLGRLVVQQVDIVLSFVRAGELGVALLFLGRAELAEAAGGDPGLGLAVGDDGELAHG